MLPWFFRQLARLPLSWLHAAGAALGWLVYRVSPTYAGRMRENLYASGVCAGAQCESLLRAAVADAVRHLKQVAAPHPLEVLPQASAAAARSLRVSKASRSSNRRTACSRRSTSTPER